MRRKRSIPRRRAPRFWFLGVVIGVFMWIWGGLWWSKKRRDEWDGSDRN